jgi:hypothetical protein
LAMSSDYRPYQAHRRVSVFHVNLHAQSSVEANLLLPLEHALTLRKRSRYRTIACIQDKPVSPSPHENPKPSSNVGMQRSRLLGLIPSAAPHCISCIKISYSIPTCEGRRRCWKLDEKTPKDLGRKHDCSEKFWSLKFVGRFGEAELQASVC